MKKIRSKKLIILFLVLAMVLTTFTACGKINSNEDVKQNEEVVEEKENKVQYPMEIEDQFGNKVTIKNEPKTIVSLAPSHTEILFSLGLGDRIVGVTEYCDYPEEAKSKEKVGSFTGVNIERIIELDPDIAFQFGPGDEEVNAKIRDAGIVLLCYEPDSIDEVMNLIQNIGKITNTEDEAIKVVDDMKAKKDEIVNKVKDEEKVKVFYEIWDDPLMAAGPGSFMDELMTLAGGENIASDAEGEYPQFDMEQLIERNPDVYLGAKDSEEKTVESIKERPGFENINAVKNDRVYLLDPNIVSRPGPRIIDALELVAKSIHPDAFK